MCLFAMVVVSFLRLIPSARKVLEKTNGLQGFTDANLEVLKLPNRRKQRVRLERDLLVQTHLHQIQVSRQLHLTCIRCHPLCNS